MNIEIVFEYFGSQSELARLLEITRAAVHSWQTIGIPPMQAIQIERITKGHFKAADIVGLKANGNDVK